MQLRKAFLILLILFTELLSISGQTIDVPVHLLPLRKPLHFDHPFFNKIIVIDNRFDSSMVINYVPGKGHIVPVRTDTTVGEAVRAYIEEATKGIPKNGRTLLLEIRRFESIPASFRQAALQLKANAYYNTGDSGFKKFMLLDINLSPIGYRSRKGTGLWVGKAIDRLLREIDSKDTVDFHDTSGAISLQTIRRCNVITEWGNYPINNTKSYPSGVYEFYQLFRRNQAEKFGFSLKMRDDSVYIVTFTDSQPDEKRRVYNWLTVTLGQGVLSYGGELYFMVQYPFCVPLRKINNTFYFHMPATLPNRYYFDLAQSESAGLRPDRSDSPQDLAFDIIGFWINDEKHRSIVKEGIKDPTLRDCYIDLDTGIIRYF